MPDNLSSLMGGSMPAAGSNKKLRKVGRVWMDESGQYFADETGQGQAYKTAAEAERGQGTATTATSAMAAQPQGQTSAMGDQKQDPELEAVMKLVSNEKYPEAYTQLKKLDKKKYAGNTQYDQIEKFLASKLGL